MGSNWTHSDMERQVQQCSLYGQPRGRAQTIPGNELIAAQSLPLTFNAELLALSHVHNNETTRLPLHILGYLCDIVNRFNFAYIRVFYIFVILA